MGIDVSEQPEQSEAESQGPAGKRRDRNQAVPAESQATELLPVGRIAQLRHELRTGMAALQWREVLLFGLLSGTLMAVSFAGGSSVSIVAGIVPVGTGLLLGRRVKGHYALHGFVTGLLGALVGITVLAVLIFLTPLGLTIRQSLDPNVLMSPLQAWSTDAGFIAFSLVAFCTFGTGPSSALVTAGRSPESLTSAPTAPPIPPLTRANATAPAANPVRTELRRGGGGAAA